MRDRANPKQDYIIGLAPYGYDPEIHGLRQLTKVSEVVRQGDT